MSMYLPNPSTTGMINTRSIFNPSKAGLNSEFFFSKISYCTIVNGPSLLCYLPITYSWRGGQTNSYLSQVPECKSEMQTVISNI